MGSLTPRLVLAHYYPWYDRSTWTSPYLVDRPQQEYSTEEPSDVQRVFESAARAGLDGLVVSWQGLDYQGGWNDCRMRWRSTPHGRRSCASPPCSETTVANPEHEQSGVPADPAVQAWMNDIVRTTEAIPPICTSATGRSCSSTRCQRLRVAEWAQVVGQVRASGPQPMLIGDATRSVWLPSFDGQFDYASNRFAIGGDIGAFHMDQGLRVRTITCSGARAHGASGPPRSAPATDDRALAAADGRTPRVSDRENGACTTMPSGVRRSWPARTG